MRVRDMEIGEVQERFANLVWDHEPIPSGQLVKLCEQELNWKKPTTYTVLRKLCEKGLFQNVNGVVSSVMSRSSLPPAAASSLWTTPSTAPCRPLWRPLPPRRACLPRRRRKFSR